MTKSLLTVFICMLLLLDVQAQSIKEAKVPEKVKNTFTGYYPEAQNATWHKGKLGYEVNFKFENIQASLVLSPDGKLLETKTAVQQTELPQSLIDYITNNYKNYKIESQDKIVDNEGTIIYKINVSKRKTKMNLFFSNDGHLIKNDH
jgi:hypothetical protein